MPRLLFSYALLLSWMAMIFILSSEGHSVSSGRSDAIVHTLQSIGITGQTDLLTFMTRKAAHTVAYFILGVLALNVVRQYQLPRKFTLLISVGVVVLYAASDELHQLYVPGRSGEIRDVLIDSVAGLLGVLLAYCIYSRYQSSSVSLVKNFIAR